MLTEEWIVLGDVFLEKSVNPTFELSNDLVFVGAEELVESQIMLFETVEERWIHLLKPVLHDIDYAVEVRMQKALGIVMSPN